jgi:hypothetical protein
MKLFMFANAARSKLSTIVLEYPVAKWTTMTATGDYKRNVSGKPCRG